MAVMSRNTPLMAILALVVLLWSATIVGKPSIEMTFCSTINTAQTSANTSSWQSDGLCSDFCRDKVYALAIIRGNTCWCSDYVPDVSVRVSISECNDECPGFPDDTCGGDNRWGYMALVKPVAGTTGVSSQPTLSQGADTTAARPTISTVTADGTIRTVTVTPTVGANSPSQANITSSNGGLGTGAVVGIVVGIIAVLVASGVMAFWLWRRKKQRKADDAMFHGASPRGSSAGMMNTPKSAEAGITPPYLGRTEGQWESDQSGRRRSTLMPIDPRIDPQHGNMYNRDGNKSHDSINTLRDDQDYSRRVHHPSKVLRATNPDPEEDVD